MVKPRTDYEINYIKNNYDKMSAGEIGRRLNRNPTFVLRILKQYNLPLYNRGLKKEDIDLFKQIYPKYTNQLLHDKYFPYLSKQQLRTQAKKFHLVKNPEKGVKWYDKDTLLDKFEFVVRELGRVPMLIELQDCGLPSEKTFKRYFGGLTEVCKILGIERPNYQHIIVADDLYYDNLNNVCLSKTEQIISNFLINNNIPFEKESLYKSVIPVEDCGEKRFDWKIGNKYIEYFGLSGYKDYDAKTNKKICLCNKYHIDLLPLYPSDMNHDYIWQNKIIEFLNK